MFFARAAAVVYVLWGVMHVVAAHDVYTLGQGFEPGMVQGRIFQDAWNLMFFALFGAIVGVVFVWRNIRLGYWLNLVVVSIGDIGFIVTMLVPGLVPVVPGAAGPVLWLIALALSTVALMRGPGAEPR